jgi:hypothetical protein
MCIRIFAITLALLLFRPVVASTDFSVNQITPAATPINARLGQISVVAAGPRLEIFPVPSSVAPLLSSWRSALRNALSRAELFREGASPSLSLSVTVMAFVRLGDTLIVFARYQLRDPTSAAPFFSADIMTDAGATSIDNEIAPLNDTAGVMHYPREVSEAVRSNIAIFVHQLETFAEPPSPPRGAPGVALAE